MAKKGKSISNPSKKIFVLDTSVILYDHDAINNFHEHDVAIPIQVLEELDHFKSGNDTRNFEARSFIRLIDETSKQKLISDWISLKTPESGKFKVVLNEKPLTINAEEVYGKGKTDHKILNAALSLKEEYPNKKVILVSKDICLRLKAKALDLNAEDYETGKIKNVDELYAGKTEIADFPVEIIEKVKKQSFIDVAEITLPHKNGNHFYVLKNKRKTANVFYNHHLKTISAVSTDAIFKIKPKNIEQAFAIHALLDPEIKLVSIQGNAGTGKTLLAVASALEQRKNFRQIYVTRPIVSLSNKDIGFLPGDAKSKTDPFMAPIWDNLRFIKEQFIGDDKMSEKIIELITTEKIAIAPLAFIRGRTLTKIFFIIDEAQNLTPHEVKTIISRAGEHTKIVFTGDIYQIDTPYLDSESNGLSYLIENAKNHPLYAHITLQKGERSELANLANELL
ncbi:PhoH family protein [Pedobacter sp. PF22-3]|uniref:PhoH family protein n=1 Tax=Pedobacter sp. PF22-3 TaxID=2994467 RepID=UPI00224700A5|nr:PhoH family protein [Pedobacter sp. PF22-3]MCX2492012.1 PhoH family protein [Pedobacter sp. PF22-3]